MTKFTITDKGTADKVLAWHREGRGIKLWQSHDLGAGRPDVVTPGDSPSPHWAYPNFCEITPDEIEFDEKEVLPIPAEWFDPCDCCKGTGLRTYADLAKIRNESIEETKIRCGTSAKAVDEDHFVCTYCHGIKHNVRRFKIRTERKYWGGWEPVGGTKFGDGTWEPPAKVASMLKRLKKHYGREDIKWDWGYAEENNMAEVTFFCSKPVLLSSLIE